MSVGFQDTPKAFTCVHDFRDRSLLEDGIGASHCNGFDYLHTWGLTIWFFSGAERLNHKHPVARVAWDLDGLECAFVQALYVTEYFMRAVSIPTNRCITNLRAVLFVVFHPYESAVEQSPCDFEVAE